jgi:hypothetical protein
MANRFIMIEGSGRDLVRIFICMATEIAKIAKTGEKIAIMGRVVGEYYVSLSRYTD